MCYRHAVRAKARRKQHVGGGPSHRRKLAEMQQGLQTRKRRANLWDMRLQAKPSWDLTKRREGEHGQRILQMEHRGLQPSFGNRVGENDEFVTGEREPTEARARVGVRQPTQTYTHVGGFTKTCERMRNACSSSDGVRLLEPLRSSSVAGKGRRATKSALPLVLPMRYSTLQL